MFELGQNARFLLQAIRALAAGVGGIQNLDGDAARQFSVLGKVDGAHAAAGDEFPKGVAGAREVRRNLQIAQSFHGLIAQKRHQNFPPNSAFASRKNSSSVEQSERSRSCAKRRNSRRAQASWLVTSLTEMPRASASCE